MDDTINYPVLRRLFFRHRSAVAACFMLACLTVGVAAGVVQARPAPSPKPSTWVEADPSTGVIRFIVNGRTEAHIDKDGLHVRRNIDFGGAMIIFPAQKDKAP